MNRPCVARYPLIFLSEGLHSRMYFLSFLQQYVVDVSVATVNDYRFTVYERSLLAGQECDKAGDLLRPSVPAYRSDISSVVRLCGDHSSIDPSRSYRINAYIAPTEIIA